MSRDIWSDPAEEAAINAFCCSQSESPDAVFVPYKTGIIRLMNGTSDVIATHLGNDSDKIYSVTLPNHGKPILSSTGFYECLGLTISSEFYKILIHAYGPTSLSLILRTIRRKLRSYQNYGYAKTEYWKVYYNARYPAHFLQYELIIRMAALKELSKVTIKRHWVNEKATIQI